MDGYAIAYTVLATAVKVSYFSFIFVNVLNLQLYGCVYCATDDKIVDNSNI